MGNRAAIAFTDRNNPKPKAYVYLHWNGGPESVYAMHAVLKERGLFNHSASYSLAQFAGLAARWVGKDGLSVGIETFATPGHAANCADDNGAYIFNMATDTVERHICTYPNGNGPTSRKLTNAEIATEVRMAHKHKYWTEMGLLDELRSMFPAEKQAA